MLGPNGLVLDSSTKPKIFTEFDSFSYSDLVSLAQVYSSFIRPYTLSLFLGSNTFDSLAFYIAAINSNSPLILLPTSIESLHLKSIVEQYKPACIFSHNPVDLIDFYSSVDNIYLSNDYTLLEDRKLLPLLMLPTSGSTGSRKLVKVSSDNLASNTTAISTYLGINSCSSHITTLPLSYTYGLSCINTHLSAAASIVLTDLSLVERSFWDLVHNYSPSTLSGVPYTYQVLRRYGSDFIKDLPIKIFTQAGGKLRSDLVLYFHQLCVDSSKSFYVMYGQTEATARISYLPPAFLPSKAGSIGIPIPNTSIQIDYSEDFGYHNGFRIGQIIFHGRNITHGYSFNTQDVYLSSAAPQSLSTGDIGYVDHDGFYFITGRLKRFSKINGIRVSLDDLESSFEPLSLAIISDDTLLYVYYTNSLSPDFICNTLKDNYQILPRLLKLKPIDSIPINSSNKVDYMALQSLL